MRFFFSSIISLLTFIIPFINKANMVNEKNYLFKSERIISKNDITYFIDPNIGDDDNIGTDKSSPWKTFKNVNQYFLTEGNRIEILSSGKFYETLFIIGVGSKEKPIEIEFAPGKYELFPQESFKEKFNISNTNDAPDSLKSIAVYFLDSKNINVKAYGADVILRGKAIDVCVNNCENIDIKGFSFDYKRPTVSEFIVENILKNYADVKIRKDSDFKIFDKKLIWIGEGWSCQPNSLWQIFNPSSNEIFRLSIPTEDLRFENHGNNKVRIYFSKNPGFEKGLIYQNRDTFRDYAAFFINESKNIKWSGTKIYFMHGLGFVHQFCENIYFDSLCVAPRIESERTSSAWADILHFSSCKGEIEVDNSYLSSANDDAVNVHGTHLIIVGFTGDNKIKVKYMHPQTYGFNAFKTGDSIEFINHKSLLPYGKNKIIDSQMLNEKEMVITLSEKLNYEIDINDAVENITWTPDFKFTNSKVTKIPTRGILVTTRGKVIIENNDFIKTYMSAILIADDASSWYESGYVTNVNISNNRFIDCGEPVINIHPENIETFEDKPIHTNINVRNNIFKLKYNSAISAKSGGRIFFENNNIQTNKKINASKLIELINCSNTKITDNYLNGVKIIINEN